MSEAETSHTLTLTERFIQVQAPQAPVIGVELRGSRNRFAHPRPRPYALAGSRFDGALLATDHEKNGSFSASRLDRHESARVVIFLKATQMARGPLRIATGMVLTPPVPRPMLGTLDFAVQACPGGLKGFVEAMRPAKDLDPRVGKIPDASTEATQTNHTTFSPSPHKSCLLKR